MAKLSLADALALAEQHRAAGRLAEAEMVCRAVAGAHPQEHAALALWGLAAQQRGDAALAADLLQQAVRLAPQTAEYHHRLAMALKTLRHVEAAEQAFRTAASLDPNSAMIHSNYGALLQDQFRLAEAAGAYRRAVALDPSYVRARNNLASVLLALGECNAALEQARKAIDLDPRHADGWVNLGAALGTLNDHAEAEKAFRHAVSLAADRAAAVGGLAAAVLSQGRIEEAIPLYRQALQLQPNHAVTWNNLGAALLAAKRPEDGEAACRMAVILRSDYPAALNNLGTCLLDQGRMPAAAAHFFRAVELDPEHAIAYSNALLCQQYRPGATAESLLELHREWDRRFARPLRTAWRPHANGRDPERRLRLGFVSPDFALHPVGMFLLPLLEHLDPARFESWCYADRVCDDSMTARLKTAAHVWRPSRTLSDEALAEQIRADRIDILFDLAGHTSKNRLLTLARKPAPIQITWMGYPGTTGLEAIDYLLADRWQVPPGAERHYVERVLRMPDDYICYQPPSYAPPVAPVPARGRGAVTFGSFNNPSKVNGEVLSRWAEVLRGVPDARLLLGYRGFDGVEAQSRYRRQFADLGVEPRRLDLRGWTSGQELLATYNEVDVALDTFPYSGGLTTCEALWMGVPVVTCPGPTFASRHTLTHLANVGLEELVAGDPQHYVRLAIELAGDLDRLASLRAGLRDRMAAAPLCDAPGFARPFMRLMRDVWRQWLAASEERGAPWPA